MSMLHFIYLFLQWKPQHDDLNCEMFADWERKNDPEQQKQGLAAHLNKKGIGNTT